MILGKFVVTAAIAYLLGAIPFALIVSRRMAGVDISKHGSGNIGGTNVLRVVGKKAGVIAIVLDVSKAVVAVTLARLVIGDSVLLVAGFPFNWQVGQVIAALMVMVGHDWSVYVGFRGGKGVAAYYGSWLAMCPGAALFGGVIILFTILVTKYMSMGSMLGALGILCLFMVVTVVAEFDVVYSVYLVYSLVTAGLIVYQHRSNIGRLRSGTELRLGAPHERVDP